MITDKQIQKIIREAPASGRKAIELRDPGERGAGRLAILIRPMVGRVAAEWYAVYYRAGKRVMNKLGSYPTVPVVEARAKFLRDYAPAISAGNNPVSAKPAAAGGSVTEMFTAYVTHLRQAGARSAGLVEGYLLSPLSGAAKSIGAHMPAASVTPDNIVPHLAKIHGRGSIAQANVVRAYLSAAFNFGMKSEHDFTRTHIGSRWGVKTNPVAAIPYNANAKRAGNRFLTTTEFRTFWHWLDTYRNASLIASAIMLKMSMGQRTEEVLRISETTYDRVKTTVYWPTTKNSLPHSVPLPHQAVVILNRLVPNAHGLFFPRVTDLTEPAAHGSFRKAIMRFLKLNPGFEPFTPRDLRRTWKTLAGAAGVSKEMRDMIQNHARGDVSSRHYDRWSYWPEKQAAMAKWAAYLDLVIAGKVDEVGGSIDNVVPFGKTASS